MIQFTTYEPNLDVDDPAERVLRAGHRHEPAVHDQRLHGRAGVRPREPGDPPDSADDRDRELAQGGIAPEVVWLFPSPEDPLTCVGAECRPDPVCLVGLENCGVGINLDPVRTFWRQTGVN